MSNVSLHAQLIDNVDRLTYNIKCRHCGKFISRNDINLNKAKFHFIPDNQFGPEESYWEHKTC